MGKCSTKGKHRSPAQKRYDDATKARNKARKAATLQRHVERNKAKRPAISS